MKEPKGSLTTESVKFIYTKKHALEMQRTIQGLMQTSQKSQLKNMKLQNKVNLLCSENERLKTQLSATAFNTEWQKYASLSKKVIILEKRAQFREDELKEILQSSKVETRRLQTLHDEEIREKDEQIESCRNKVRNLMCQVRKYALQREAEIAKNK